MARPSKLPVHPRELILALLRKSKTPLTAYGMLEKLRPKGVKSAPIIYRALAELETQGIVHKIKELGAFIACNCTKSHQHALSVLTVCGECKDVQELHDHAVIHQLEGLRRQGVRLQEQAVIELPITCNACAA